MVVIALICTSSTKQIRLAGYAAGPGAYLRLVHNLCIICEIFSRKNTTRKVSHEKEGLRAEMPCLCNKVL